VLAVWKTARRQSETVHFKSVGQVATRGKAVVEGRVDVKGKAAVRGQVAHGGKAVVKGQPKARQLWKVG